MMTHNHPGMKDYVYTPISGLPSICGIMDEQKLLQIELRKDQDEATVCVAGLSATDFQAVSFLLILRQSVRLCFTLRAFEGSEVVPVGRCQCCADLWFLAPIEDRRYEQACLQRHLN
ncbi:hypothetical protein NDU88_002060 [Pleurodeles waltl]|uniref:Uncharacterized protein n=1 Tax=Pleurodeles waltl TaxID=8319 RepID=A0AAV7LBA0_PLEWA|nr:hypothetical protein NDU88_002060 [Pleurodeles waltl]